MGIASLQFTNLRMRLSHLALVSFQYVIYFELKLLLLFYGGDMIVSCFQFLQFFGLISRDIVMFKCLSNVENELTDNFTLKV